jgi:hypothetical protein
MKARLNIALLSLACTACGTVFHGTKQTLELTSTPAGAVFHAEPSGISGTTPAKIELSRGVDHVIVFDGDGGIPRKFYIHRTLSLGTSTADAWVPFVGIVGLAIDNASGAQFRLVPDTLHVDLTAALQPETEVANSDVFIYNANTKGSVHFVLGDDNECELKLGEYAVRRINKGVVHLSVYHWDVFKFQNAYDIGIDTNVSNIALFSSVFDTHYAFSNAIPDGFSEACKPSS